MTTSVSISLFSPFTTLQVQHTKIDEITNMSLQQTIGKNNMNKQNSLDFTSIN